MIQGTCIGNRTGRTYKYVILERTTLCQNFLLEMGFKKVEFKEKEILIETSKNNLFNSIVSISPEDERKLIVIVFDNMVANYPHFMDSAEEFFRHYKSDFQEALLKI